jgi:hypothetical protein
LIELLTAIAILAVIVLVLVQMAGMASTTWLGVQKQANNFSKARAMLDLIARDVQSGIYRDDLAAFPSGSAAFYTKRPGVVSGSAAMRSVSLVKYEISTSSTNSILSRGDMAISWSGSANAISFGNASTLPADTSVTMRDTAPGVVAFKVLFIKADGTTTTTYPTTSGTNPVRAVGISLAVVDDSSLKRLTPGNINALQQALSASTTGTGSPTAAWDAYLTSHWASYPRGLSGGLKMFERYVFIQ